MALLASSNLVESLMPFYGDEGAFGLGAKYFRKNEIDSYFETFLG